MLSWFDVTRSSVPAAAAVVLLGLTSGCGRILYGALTEGGVGLADAGPDASVDAPGVDASSDAPPDAGPPLPAVAVAFGGDGDDDALAVAPAGDGAFVAGEFSSTVDFGAGPVSSGGAGWNGYWLSLDAASAPGWLHTAASPGNTSGTAVIALVGSVMLGGVIFGGTDVFGAGHVANGTTDAILARVAMDGTPMWVRQFGGAGADELIDMAPIGADGLVIVGRMEDRIDFGGGALVSAGQRDMFVARLRTDGTHEWSRTIGGAGLDEARAVSVAQGSDICVSGWSTGDIDVDGAILPARSSTDCVVVRLTADGSVLWADRFGAAVPDNCRGVVALEDRCWVAGQYTGTMDTAPVTLPAAGASKAAFVLAIDAGGTPLAGAAAASTGEVDSYSLASRPGEQITVGMRFTGTLTFAGESFVSSGMRDVFLATFDRTGLPVGGLSFGGSADDVVYQLRGGGRGELMVAGAFQDRMDVLGHTLVARGGSDLYVLRIP